MSRRATFGEYTIAQDDDGEVTLTKDGETIALEWVEDPREPLNLPRMLWANKLGVPRLPADRDSQR